MEVNMKTAKMAQDKRGAADKVALAKAEAAAKKAAEAKAAAMAAAKARREAASKDAAARNAKAARAARGAGGGGGTKDVGGSRAAGGARGAAGVSDAAGVGAGRAADGTGVTGSVEFAGAAGGVAGVGIGHAGVPDGEAGIGGAPVPGGAGVEVGFGGAAGAESAQAAGGPRIKAGFGETAGGGATGVSGGSADVGAAGATVGKGGKAGIGSARAAGGTAGFEGAGTAGRAGAAVSVGAAKGAGGAAGNEGVRAVGDAGVKVGVGADGAAGAAGGAGAAGAVGGAPGIGGAWPAGGTKGKAGVGDAAAADGAGGVGAAGAAGGAAGIGGARAAGGARSKSGVGVAGAADAAEGVGAGGTAGVAAAIGGAWATGGAGAGGAGSKVGAGAAGTSGAPGGVGAGGTAGGASGIGGALATGVAGAGGAGSKVAAGAAGTAGTPGGVGAAGAASGASGIGGARAAGGAGGKAGVGSAGVAPDAAGEAGVGSARGASGARGKAGVGVAGGAGGATGVGAAKAAAGAGSKAGFGGAGTAGGAVDKAGVGTARAAGGTGGGPGVGNAHIDGGAIGAGGDTGEHYDGVHTGVGVGADGGAGGGAGHEGEFSGAGEGHPVYKKNEALLTYSDEEIKGERGVKGGHKKQERQGPLAPGLVIGEDIHEDLSDENGKSEKTEKRRKKGNLVVEETVDPGVYFHAGLSDCKAIIGEAAEIQCKVSSEDCKGIWYKDGEEIKSSEDMTISEEGSIHRLKIHKATEEHAGKYRFEADGRKTEAAVIVEDPPRCDPEELKAFKAPVTVKNGQKATFRLAYIGREPFKVQWYLEGEELSDEANIKLEHTDSSSRLLLNKLQRKNSGEIKIKIKNEFGTIEAFTQLTILAKSTPALGPLEIVEASPSAIEIKWRPPKDSGGCKIKNYILERQQVGRNTWNKIGPIGPEAKYRDINVDHGRRYSYRIRVETEMGISELMETEDVQAGTKAYPGPPSPPKVVSAVKGCISLAWSPPSNTGGTNILGYQLEKRKKGSNIWGAVNPPDEMIKGIKYDVKDVAEGLEYEFRLSAINNSGAGEYSTPSEFVFARDPKKSPGKVIDLKVTDSTYTTVTLSWNTPKEIKGEEDEAKGYFVEVRPAENPDWDRCNTNAIIMTTYTVKCMKSLAMYWVRVIATNDGGEGEPEELDHYILVMPPPVRPRFTDAKIKSFMVVRAGNSARFNIYFEASPWPEVIWLKDGMPVSKRVTISNTEGASQLFIASAERSDTGIYTVVVKNIVGQETFSTEIRVTDEPKPTGPVELDENVPGTLTVSWEPSPDEKRDDRLHYMVTKRDSNKRAWHTVADHIFNNKFTISNIMPGREYQFRVYAKNDMGSSKPTESTKWSVSRKKEKFSVNVPETKACNFDRPPKFIVPLKMHTAPQGYECYMSCAIRGEPTPHVTWLRNNISLNTNTNYYISNTCGVCSLLILRVGLKDTGEYKVIAENPLGIAECATKLTVRE